jgi:hypothetical protein
MILDEPFTPTPLGSPIWVDKSHGQSMWPMKVRVRELNVEQELRFHWRLVSKDDMMPQFFDRPLDPQGDAVLRDLEFVVQSDPLRDRQCARLDLAVSGSFFKNTSDPGLFAFTREDDVDNSDLAVVSWLIFEGPGQTNTSDLDKAHIVSSCPTVDAPATPATAPMMDMETTP